MPHLKLPAIGLISVFILGCSAEVESGNFPLPKLHRPLNPPFL